MRALSTAPLASIVRGVPIQDDFVGGSAGTTGTIGEHGWSFSASGSGTVTQIAGEVGHPGIRRLTTGATGTSAVALYLGPGATSGPFISGDIDDVYALVRPAPLLDIADATIQIGFSSDQNIDAATERCVIELNVASAFWQAISEVAAGTETTVTSVTATANTWYLIRIKRDAATGNWSFYINGALVATHSTRKPSTAAVMLICRILQRTVAVETIDVDAFEMWPRSMARY